MNKKFYVRYDEKTEFGFIAYNQKTYFDNYEDANDDMKWRENHPTHYYNVNIIDTLKEAQEDE